MATTVHLYRIVVGNVPGTAALDCVAPLQPYVAYMEDLTTHTPYTLAFCADPTVDPCAANGVFDVLNNAEFVMDDDPCEGP